MERLRGWVDRVRAAFAAPAKKPSGWLVGDEPAPTQKPTAAENLFSGFKAFWVNQRRRVLRLLAALVALTDLILGAFLYSNIWYLNLLLYAYLVPSFIITIHYMRLTRK